MRSKESYSKTLSCKSKNSELLSRHRLFESRMNPFFISSDLSTVDFDTGKAQDNIFRLDLNYFVIF